MATTRVGWQNEQHYDLHVVRGHQTRRLDEILVLVQDPPPSVFASATPPPADVAKVEFQPLINHTGAVLGLIAAHGVVVSTTTGLVRTFATPPVPALANFIIDARVRVRVPGGTRDLPAAQMRMHVHNGVTDAWLTPSPRLRIRRGADGQRFSVLARFDNGTVGDLTANHGVTWGSSDPAVQVDADGALTGTALSGPVTVTATLPAELGGFSRSAEVEVLAPWGSLPAAARVATKLSGPGVPAMGRVPNVLFLPDGFEASGQADFEALAADFVRKLNTGTITTPFNLLKDSINYWSAFLPSPVPGSSPLHELDLQPRLSGTGGGTSTVGVEIPVPLRPDPASTEPFTFPELLHEVGLPIRDNVLAPGPPSTPISNADIEARWTTLYPVDRTRLTPALIGAWRELHDRRLVEERDTALGVASGQRPAMTLLSPGRMLGPNPRRTTRAHLDQYLATLIDSVTGTPIGATWNSSSAPRGKDSDLVIVLCAGSQRAGGRTANAQDQTRTDLVATGLVLTEEVPLIVGAGPQVLTIPHPLPRKPSGTPAVIAETLAVATHEMCHALGLGDEYGERIDLTDEIIEEARRFLNLQPRKDLLDGAGRLVATAVRWRWPQLQRAGRVTGFPAAQGGGDFQVELAPGHTRSFAAGDKVRLRLPLPFGAVSRELEVTAVNPAANLVRVHEPTSPPAPAGTLPAVLFPPDSVLGVPVPPPPSAPAGELFAELMAQKIRAHITTTHGPLNAPAATPQRPCVPDPNPDPIPVQRPGNLPAGLPRRQPRYRAWIVGLYEGGKDQACGVYHPTGACQMRSHRVPYRDPASGAPPPPRVVGVLYRFCNVCRYILVDRIDPSRHKELNELVVKQKLYPQPR
jgi:hypothetical protein